MRIETSSFAPGTAAAFAGPSTFGSVTFLNIASAALRALGGLGLSIISAIAVKEEVAAGELVLLAPKPRLARMLGIVRRRDKPSTPALTAVISALEEFARKSGVTAASSA